MVCVCLGHAMVCVSLGPAMVCVSIGPAMVCDNNNNFIYTLESEVKLCSVVFTITYSNKTGREIKNVNTFINYLLHFKTEKLTKMQVILTFKNKYNVYTLL